MSKSIPPPEFSESMGWTDFKKEIKIWQALTTLDDEKQGPCLYLSLKGKAREAALELDLDKIKGKDGVDLILKRLDELYLEDTTQTAYLAYQNFETFKRPETMKMKDYLVKFEQLYTKIKDHQMVLPDGVLAYRVLNSANLSNEQMTLCRATMTDLKYDDMVKQLKRLFADAITSAPVGEHSAQGATKEEPVFFNDSNADTNSAYYGDSRRRPWYRGNKSRGRGNFNHQRRGGSDNKGIMNPVDRDGNVTRCRICDSKFHWHQDCTVNPKGPEKITLFQAKDIDNEETRIFVGETLSCAVLDSGCSQTVCGKNWLECFQESLDEEENITEKQSHATFKFGNGGPVKSLKKVSLPVIIGTQAIDLETDVVDTDIPLLLSKNAMKKSSTVIDFNKDTATMFGEEQKLIRTSSGHYAIPLTKKRKIIENSSTEEMQSIIENSPTEEIRSVLACMNAVAPSENDIKKLHRQFGHCHESRLLRLIDSSKLWSDMKHVSKIVKMVSEDCDICKRYKRRQLRPVVSIPLASEFNQTVAMDLITYEQGVWILHLVDLFSRYSAACVRRSKKQEVIVDAIMKVWVSYFGRPKKFIADNGGEFLNEEYREMCEMLNVEEAKTAAESPWANGVCERHNAVIKETVRKTMEESKCSLETAVVWAVSAKNSLSGHQGYSPNVLVFGKNTNFPSVLTNELPAMETKISSATVENNLKTMNSARKAFIEAECSEKIKRALKHTVRSCNDAVFENGDKVYYKRNNNPRWKGPGCVIGQDGKNVLIKHGGETIRVHPVSLIHVHKAVPTNPENVQNLASKEKTPDFKMMENDEDEAQEENNLEMDREDEAEEENNLEMDQESTKITTEADKIHIDKTAAVKETKSEETKFLLPPMKARIAYRVKDSDRLSEGVVHSRAGKATGKYRYHLNVQSPDNEIKVLDFSSEVQEWHPITEVLIASSTNKENIQAAKEKELKNWSENNVYSEVDDNNQYTISCRWVIETKKMDGLDVTKARLCARGFEDEEGTSRRTDSPTCSKEALRITFAIIASSNWTCKSMDIKRAFLQGKALDREIFIKPPKEANTNKLWRLNKCVYGLNEASRYWYNRVHEEFRKIGPKTTFILKLMTTTSIQSAVVG